MQVSTMATPPREGDDGSGETHGARVRTCFVAAYSCPETERIGREMGFPVAVIAASSDPARHAAHLTGTQYAAWSPREPAAWPLPFDDGFAFGADFEYRQLAFDARWLGSAALPAGVDLEGGCLRVSLPGGTSSADLANLLRGGLAEMSYEDVARRPGLVRRRFETGRPVVAVPRYALSSAERHDRFVVARDLYRFRPGDLATVACVLSLCVDSLALSIGIDRVLDEALAGVRRHG